MVCYGENLLLRHKLLKDRPFLVLEKKTLEEAPASRWLGFKEGQNERLDWSNSESASSPE